MSKGEAKVRVELGETVGGPDFSSVRVHVAIEVSCDAVGATIDKSANALHERALSLLDSYIPIQYSGLLAHLDAIHGDS